MSKVRGLFALATAMTLLAVGCAQGGVTMSAGKVPASVRGNVVSIPMTVENFEIVKADGDTSGKTGHFHVFIDRAPVKAGQTIPKEKGIVHSAENPIKLYGLSVGHHEFRIVLGDGTHKRIYGDELASVKVNVKGPSVDGDAPATIKEGDDLTVTLKAQGVKIVKPDGKRTKKTGHFHVLVDPKVAPSAGDQIGAPVENSVIHTTESSAIVSGLKKGEHTLWVVLGDGQHYAFDPAVMDKLTVTVE